MSLEEIETAITKLPKEDFEKLSIWISERSQAEWDRQFEEEVKSGKFDAAWETALKEISAGETKPLNQLCDNA